MAGETLSAGLGEIIHSEAIPSYLAQARLGPDLSGTVCWVERVGPRMGTNFRFNVADEVTITAGTKTEGTASFTNQAWGVSKSVANSGVVGIVLDVSREARHDTVTGIPRDMLDGAILAMRKRLNQDVFSVVANATSSAGAAADVLTAANLAAGLAEVETLNPGGNLAMVIGSQQPWADLLANLVSTSTTLLPSQGGGAVARGGVGLKGSLLGASLFTSPHIATEAGSPNARNNAIVEVGRGRSGLCLAVWEGITVELEPQPVRYADRWVVFARYGTVCNNDAIVTEVLSRAAA
jgi:hypothetical protein